MWPRFLLLQLTNCCHLLNSTNRTELRIDSISFEETLLFRLLVNGSCAFEIFHHQLILLLEHCLLVLDVANFTDFLLTVFKHIEKLLVFYHGLKFVLSIVEHSFLLWIIVIKSLCLLMLSLCFCLNHLCDRGRYLDVVIDLITKRCFLPAFI